MLLSLIVVLFSTREGAQKFATSPFRDAETQINSTAAAVYSRRSETSVRTMPYMVVGKLVALLDHLFHRGGHVRLWNDPPSPRIVRLCLVSLHAFRKNDPRLRVSLKRCAVGLSHEVSSNVPPLTALTMPEYWARGLGSP